MYSRDWCLWLCVCVCLRAGCTLRVRVLDQYNTKTYGGHKKLIIASQHNKWSGVEG